MRKRITALIGVAVMMIGFFGYFAIDGFGSSIKAQLREAYHSDLSIGERLQNLRDGTDTVFNTVFAKNQYVRLNGLFQRALGIQYVYDVERDRDVVKLNNGYLTFIYAQCEYVEERAQKVIDFRAYLAEEGVPFLYVQAPYKIDEQNPQLPTGVFDFANDTATRFLGLMQKTDMEIIDLRQAMRDEQLDHYRSFFRTDHHWKPETGFWTAGQVMQYLNSHHQLGANPSVWDISNYTVDVKQAWFLGSQGKRTGDLYAGVDDVAIITPKFDTHLEMTRPTAKVTVTGDFETTLLSQGKIESKDYFALNPYAVYTGGDYDLQIIKNADLTEGKKVLLIRDSFSCVVAPFLSLGCSELHIYDLRHNHTSIKTYISEVQPDIVVMLYTTNSLYNGPCFTLD